MNINTPSKKEIESIKTDTDATGRFLNSPTSRRTLLNRISFQTALLFAPLAYAFHHIEEHIFFNFRVWRLKYFPDSNHLTTETVFCILTAVTLIYIILHAIAKNRASAQSAILFLMATQLHNALFHLGGAIYFRDWSPGTITAVFLYLPVTFLILQKALVEGWINRLSGIVLFILGGMVFWSFEALGPLPMVALLIATWAWIAYEEFTSSPGTG